MTESESHLGLVLSYFGILQKDAANAVGVDPAMVTRWKNGTERLGVDSPRMRPLVDYILSPSHRLSEADLRWLRSRFAEAGIDTQIASEDDLRRALATYLANDGSRFGEQDDALQQLLSQRTFALQGLATIMRLVDAELDRLPEGRPFLLVVSGRGIEREDGFHEMLARAVARGLRMRLLLDLADAPGERAPHSADSEMVWRYLPQLVHTHARVRLTSNRVSSGLCSGVQTTLLVPDKLCLHITGQMEDTPYVACAIRERAYLTALEADLNRTWAAAQELFDDPHETTPRAVSAQLARIYRTSSDVRVVCDGLNPLFMAPEAFDQLLERQGTSDTERVWRVEAFAREHDEAERRLAEGGSYREMTSALDDLETLACGASSTRRPIATYGQTFFGASGVDVPAALDILEGYLRLATLYPRFEVRFSNACRDLSKGLWVTGSSSLPQDVSQPADAFPASSFVFWQRSDGSVRQLTSGSDELVSAMAAGFDEAWNRMRFRVWHDGQLLTHDRAATIDSSVSVHFIRMKIEELERLLQRDVFDY